jgi:hypothetical protein
VTCGIIHWTFFLSSVVEPVVASLVDIHAQLPQVGLGLVDLSHKLLVRFGNIVKGEDTPAETEEEESAEGDEGPEGKLIHERQYACTVIKRSIRGATYDRDDLLLDESGQGDQFEVESKVDLEDNMLVFSKL